MEGPETLYERIDELILRYLLFNEGPGGKRPGEAELTTPYSTYWIPVSGEAYRLRLEEVLGDDQTESGVKVMLKPPDSFGAVFYLSYRDIVEMVANRDVEALARYISNVARDSGCDPRILAEKVIEFCTAEEEPPGSETDLSPPSLKSVQQAVWNHIRNEKPGPGTVLGTWALAVAGRVAKSIEAKLEGKPADLGEPPLDISKEEEVKKYVSSRIRELAGEHGVPPEALVSDWTG